MKSISTTFANNLFKHIENGKNLPELLKTTKSFLENKGLANYYLIILSKLQKKLDTKKKYETVQIKSPFEINQETTNNILKKFSLENNPSKVILDKSLIAGFVLTQKGVVRDASVKTLLRKFTQK